MSEDGKNVLDRNQGRRWVFSGRSKPRLYLEPSTIENCHHYGGRARNLIDLLPVIRSAQNVRKNGTNREKEFKQKQTADRAIFLTTGPTGRELLENAGWQYQETVGDRHHYCQTGQVRAEPVRRFQIEAFFVFRQARGCQSVSI